MAYFDSFPIRLRPYIVDVQDVATDGNCGFRAVANILGIGEENWSLVRKDLIKELESHFDDYSRLYGNDDMTMPDMGYVIASRYKIILVHLSQQQCLTFLPLWDEPFAIASHKIVAIRFANNCHFVSINWHTSGPMPPIACNWYKYHHPCAEGWATPYHARMQFFRSLVEECVAISEIIDLDKP
ncbi:uncharacterized protein LOC111404755 [Olea europaea var. sylvestris]|uniref:uncharacterized protein LOC111404755 n=1 Tax=Olea europaea var. sylvestris TaxID=158386 RepID=UPI000C1D8B09|nr:uncharacterized protein LOC111404755 [Olea europaea var. sylvestris]